MGDGLQTGEATFGSLSPSTRALWEILRNLAFYCADDRLEHVRLTPLDHGVIEPPRKRPIAPCVRSTTNLLSDVAWLFALDGQRDLSALASEARRRLRDRYLDELPILPDWRILAVWLARRMTQEQPSTQPSSLRERANELAPLVLGFGFHREDSVDRVSEGVPDKVAQKYERSDIREAVIAMLKGAGCPPRTADHVFDHDLRKAKGKRARK